MTDLVVFGAIVALMIAVGVGVGIIVAGRIDRLTAPRRAPGDVPAVTAEEAADPVEEQA